jgi:pimeloyl-ACP methyl ester carboxylesterase
MKRFAVVLATLAVLLAAATAPAVAAAEEGYEVTSTELQIQSRDVQVPATVVAPVAEADETFPLVVIHHGHGGGRNENGGLARVADALAQAGIISIRFDFAGAGDSQEPFTQLSYTTMLADSDAALAYALGNLPIDENRIGAFGYSEGSAVTAIQAGDPANPYKAIALMGPVARPGELMSEHFGGPDAWAALYEEAQANGYADVTTPWGQVQSTSLEWFEETLAADPAGDIQSFTGPVLIVWGEAEQTIPYGEVEAYVAATEGSAASTELVAIPEADHGYGFYSEQPEVDAALHGALVDFYVEALSG